MVIVQCEACNRTIHSDENFYLLGKAYCPDDVITETWPRERRHFCNECIDKAINFLIPDIQKEIMAKFDELVKNLKKEG